MRRTVSIILLLSLCMTGCKEVSEVKEERSGEWTPGLSESEMNTLFAIAEDTLKWQVSEGGKGDFFKGRNYDITAKLKTDYATFVTLKINDMLRGCIGSLQAYEPLYLSVHHNAVNASVKDFRFRPVSSNELPQLDVHISVLSPMKSIKSLDEFTLGEHGIILQKGMNRAVYLPEVAIEQKWNKEETLSSLSQKAGMAADAWKKGTSFQVFSSVVISKTENEQ